MEHQLPRISCPPLGEPLHRCARFCAHRHTVPAVLRVERLRSSSAGRHGIRGMVRRARISRGCRFFPGAIVAIITASRKKREIALAWCALAPDQVSAEPPEASGIWLIGGAEGLQPHPDDGAIVAARRITELHNQATGLFHDGSVACWGLGLDGQSSPPEGVFTSVSAGLFHTCGVRPDGSVECWGRD